MGGGNRCIPIVCNLGNKIEPKEQLGPKRAMD